MTRLLVPRVWAFCGDKDTVPEAVVLHADVQRLEAVVEAAQRFMAEASAMGHDADSRPLRAALAALEKP